MVDYFSTQVLICASTSPSPSEDILSYCALNLAHLNFCLMSNVGNVRINFKFIIQHEENTASF